VLLALAGAANAQPDPTPIDPTPIDPVKPYPDPPSPYPEPLPQPEPDPQPITPPPPVAVPPPVLPLTKDEIAILQRGEIDQDTHYQGIAASVIGFGLGQAIQGRWWETGWKITAGMLGSMVMFVAFADSNGLLQVTGALALTGFYIYGFVDAGIGPSKHNRRLRELRTRMTMQAMPYVNRSRDGGTAGLVLRF
jgi:hypothetical protein